MSARAIEFDEARLIVHSSLDEIYKDRNEYVEVNKTVPQYAHISPMLLEAYDTYYSIVSDNDSLFNLNGVYYTFSLELKFDARTGNMFDVIVD